MTASALGLHQKLEKRYGKDFVNTDKYWNTIDSTKRYRDWETDRKSTRLNSSH